MAYCSLKAAYLFKRSACLAIADYLALSSALNSLGVLAFNFSFNIAFSASISAYFFDFLFGGGEFFFVGGDFIAALSTREITLGSLEKYSSGRNVDA